MPQTGSHARFDSSELLLCPSAGSACRSCLQSQRGHGLFPGSAEPHTAGWKAGGMEMKVPSVPGDTPQSISPSSCSQGDSSCTGDVSHQGCLVAVPALQWRGDISVCGQAELWDKDLCLLTGRIAFHRKAIMHLNKRRSNTRAAN